LATLYQFAISYHVEMLVRIVCTILGLNDANFRDLELPLITPNHPFIYFALLLAFFLHNVWVQTVILPVSRLKVAVGDVHGGRAYGSAIPFPFTCR